MKQLSRYICGKVIACTESSKGKLVFRIDGFEDLRLYHALCVSISEYCLHHGVTLVAKLAYAKYEQLKDTAPYEATKLLTNGWIDTENRMTFYRNQLPKDGERLLVLLLGTDMVADKGGLKDFYAITPHTLDTEIGKHYDRLLSRELLALYPEEETLRGVVNGFFGELFSCVPKNLSRVSAIMDGWESDAPEIQDIVATLYKKLPEWQIPKVEGGCPSVSKLLNEKKKRQGILYKADSFIKGKTYPRVTQSTLSNIEAKFDGYINEGKEYADQYPDGQAIENLTELKRCVLRFLAGDRDSRLRARLIWTDFSILDKILDFKLRKPPPPPKAASVTGDPLSVMTKAILTAVGSRETADRVVVRLLEVGLCGVPLNLGDAGDETSDADQLLEEAWHSIAVFAGGVIPFIDRESWGRPDGSVLEIEEQPQAFFAPDSAVQLREDGILKRVTGSTHKIFFRVEVYEGERRLGIDEYKWQIDPYEDWTAAFSGLSRMPDVKEYIPFSTMTDINGAFAQRDDEGFAYYLDHAPIIPLTGKDSLIERWQTMAAVPESFAEEHHFRKLGERFQQFRQALLHRGFFTAITKEIPDLIDEYLTMAQSIHSQPIYLQTLRSNVKLFANAFAICNTAAPVFNDIFTPQMIIPPYHPATLEKLSDRMIFIRTGMKEWYDDGAAVGSLQKRLDELLSLSRIHSATDAFCPSGFMVRSFNKTHGYYTLYGNYEPVSTFVSAQDVQQKEMVFEDDFDERDMKRMSREAEVLLGVLHQYGETFEQGNGTLSLAFINPEDLQIIVAALYKYIDMIRKAEAERRISLKITIVTRSEVQGARTYLAYWINSVFTTDDDIDIKVYLRQYHNDREIPGLVEPTTDVAFFFDALDTDRGAAYNIVRSDHAIGECMADCRFPMVFKPSIAMQGATEHNIVITQPQFRAATAHTQLLRSYMSQELVDSSSQYEMRQSASIKLERGGIIKELQNKVVWLACIDSAMDKKTVRDLYADDSGIIGFTTGEGSFGQLNMAITCGVDTKLDLLKRCRRRLHALFPSWSGEYLDAAASFCVEKARDLDGMSILRAMNPNDQEIRNYLAYLIASELTKNDAGALNVLIRLDSYRHWFRNDAQAETKIPDFLQITAEIQPGGRLHFIATVIEAKIANSTTLDTEHLPKALKQVEQGLSVLQACFDPNPERPTVEHRYWLAQLYRALVFLQGDIRLETGLFEELSAQLSRMLEGDYTIEWHCRILACPIDSNSFIERGEYMGVDCWYIGQLAFQNLLLNRAAEEHGVTYDAQAALEQEDTDSEEIPGFAQPVRLGDRSDPHTMPAGASSDAHETEYKQGAGDDGGADSQTEPAVVVPPEPGPILVPDESELLPLEEVRVLIGNDRGKRPVYWEFGHKELANRHLLITGGSGQGKTYAIQTFLYELAKQKISSVVFDYTDGFLPDKLEPPFAEALGDRIVQHIAIMGRQIRINPFKRQMLTIAGMKDLEKSTFVASRFAAIMKHVYSFGEQQYSALYTACRDGIDRYGDDMNFEKLKRNLENMTSPQSKTVLSKMQQLFDADLFDTENAFDWSEITKRDGRVTVIQLTNLDREIQTVITEMLMWDAWYAMVKTGTKDDPFVVVLDEAQNLSIADGSPAQKILQEGRKYGWSAWFATQFLKGALNTDEISRLQQAAEVLYFKPSNEETTWVAQQLADSSKSSADWVNDIKQMQKGYCIVRGDRIRPNNTFGAAQAVMVKVSSFEHRD